MVLLDQAPGWEARIFPLSPGNSCYIGQDRSACLGFAPPGALLAQGRKDEARRILKPCSSGKLETIASTKPWSSSTARPPFPLLDRVFARDSFQERPLVWKARLLLDEGKLDEAEKIAREAIKIDPSDGEEAQRR